MLTTQNDMLRIRLIIYKTEQLLFVEFEQIIFKVEMP